MCVIEVDWFFIEDRGKDSEVFVDYLILCW